MPFSKEILIALDDSLLAAGLAAILASLSNVAIINPGLSLLAEAIEAHRPLLVFLGSTLGGRSIVRQLPQLVGRFPSTAFVGILRDQDMVTIDLFQDAGVAAIHSYSTSDQEIVLRTKTLLGGGGYQREGDRGVYDGAPHDAGLYPNAALSTLQGRLVELFARGMTVDAAAQRLQRSAKDIEYHRREIRRKLGLASQVQIDWKRVRCNPKNF